MMSAFNDSIIWMVFGIVFAAFFVTFIIRSIYRIKRRRCVGCGKPLLLVENKCASCNYYYGK